MSGPVLTDADGIVAAVARFSSRYKAGVVSVYLFGSRAWGMPHRESDFDLAVLLSGAAATDRRRRDELQERLAGELVAVLHLNRVDLVVLNDAPPLLARRIMLDGKRILCWDAEADRAFTRDIMLRAADLAPFLERAARTKLEALQR